MSKQKIQLISWSELLYSSPPTQHTQGIASSIANTARLEVQLNGRVLAYDCEPWLQSLHFHLRGYTFHCYFLLHKEKKCIFCAKMSPLLICVCTTQIRRAHQILGTRVLPKCSGCWATFSSPYFLSAQVQSLVTFIITLHSIQEYMKDNEITGWKYLH